MNIQAVMPIRRQTLHDELVTRLRDLIIEGALAPGAKISEKDLCERFDVSRTPLREALKVLATEGLVELVPNRGATVSQLTLADLEEAFPIMGALEALSGELACRQIKDAEIARIRDLHRRMVAKYQAGDRQRYFALNQQIHQAIVEAANNNALGQIQRGLSARLRRARYMANMSAERWAKAVEEHEAILQALEARDGERLGKILKAHLANKLETVREALADANLGDR